MFSWTNLLAIVAIAAILLWALWLVFDGESLTGVIIAMVAAVSSVFWITLATSESGKGQSISINADNWTCTRSKTVLMQIVVGKTTQLLPRDICIQYTEKAQ